MSYCGSIAKDFIAVAIFAALSGGLGIAVNALRPNPVDWHYGFAKSKDSPRGEIPVSPKSITLEEVHAQEGKAGWVIIDARSDGFYAMGHIPGAVSLPRKEMESDPGKWQTRANHLLHERHAEQVVVYCSGLDCTDSDAVARHLITIGWKNVSILKEGWAAWKENQLPVEKSDE